MELQKNIALEMSGIIPGIKLGRCIYIGYIGKNKHHQKLGLFECSCGKLFNHIISEIKTLRCKSCGCLLKETSKKNASVLITHGMKGTRIYSIRSSIKRRCNNFKDTSYKYYGGKGIKYDKKREDFAGFYEDMKDGYSEYLTIERIDRDGNYCKENCKRATYTEQGRNRSNNTMFEGKCISKHCEELGLNTNTFWSRVRRGKTIREALYK